MAEDMAQQHEMWITQGPPGDQPPSGPPNGSPPHGPGHGWGRWIAIVAGFAVLIGIVAAQHLISGPTGRSAQPTTGESVTPQPTGSRPETPDTATSMTEVPGDSSPSQPTAYPQTFTGHGGPYTTSAAELSPAAPVTTTAARSLPGEGWELVGLQWSGGISSGGVAVVTYRPSTGRVVTTHVPAINSNGPLSFVATSDAAIIRPMDNVDGYVVPNGDPATVSGGLLNAGGQIFPSGDPRRVWVTSSRADRLTIAMADSAGKAMGATLQTASALVDGMMLTRDGAGSVLAAGVGGVYDVGADGVHLVTHGRVLAAGPTGYLLYECNDAGDCAAVVLDRATGKRDRLPGYVVSGSMIASPVQGVISPDGRYAAVVDYASEGARIVLIDLRTGRSALVGRSPNSGPVMYGDASSTLAFTPDSRQVLIAGADGVSVIDVATAKAGSLPLPPLAAIAIRPAG